MSLKNRREAIETARKEMSDNRFRGLNHIQWLVLILILPWFIGVIIYLIAFFPLIVALWLFAVVTIATILGYLFSWAVHISEKNFKDYEDL